MNTRAWPGLAPCIVTLILTLGGCSSGEQTAGIEGSGVSPGSPPGVTSSGAVTALGSIFVNGVEYDLTGAAITIDGDPATEADLDVGSIVIVEGDLDEGGATGTATRVTAGIAVAGPIDAMDEGAETISVLGQIVQIDGFTIIENRIAGAFAGGLGVGDDVTVTGFVNSAGIWSARRIAARSADDPLRVSGQAANVNSAAGQFTIGGLAVDYSGATVIGFDNRELSGAPVRVIGTGFDTDGALIASELAYRDPHLPGADGDIVQLQGWVTRFASGADFDVDGHPVRTMAYTVIEGTEGFLGQVRLDTFVNVRGNLYGGIVLATEIRPNTLIGIDTVIWGIGSGVNIPGDSVDDFQFVTADLWAAAAYQCHVDAQTIITIDGLPAGLDEIQAGDVATIYENHDHALSAGDYPSTCQIIGVNHKVRGPIEAKPANSAWLTVMGQRVWLDTAPPTTNSSGVTDLFASLDSLNVGDIVEVGGHLTAEGDILAKSIHVAAVGRAYRVVGFARDIDTAYQRFRLGELEIYYANASLSGFAADVPHEGDRVLVESNMAPNAGSLVAGVVRYDGNVPRGARGNVLKLNGLITRFVSPDDFDVDGRKTIPIDPPYDPTYSPSRCDLAKLHLDMRFMLLVAGGNLDGGPPIYFSPICQFGRRIDERSDMSGFYGSPALSITGPVQSIDPGNYSLSIAGISLNLNPGTLLSRFDLPPENPDGPILNYVSSPIFFADLAVGDRVVVRSNALQQVNGVRDVSSVFLGDGVPMDSEDVSITAQLVAASEPELTLASGIGITVPDGVSFEIESCGDIYPSVPEPFSSQAATAFWSQAEQALIGTSITVAGSLNGSELVPSRIRYTDLHAECGWNYDY